MRAALSIERETCTLGMKRTSYRFAKSPDSFQDLSHPAIGTHPHTTRFKGGSPLRSRSMFTATPSAILLNEAGTQAWGAASGA